MTGTLYIVGVGPGDPELITMRALRLFTSCPVICVPKGKKDGESVALGIAGAAVDLAGKEIVELHFPMEKIRMGDDPAPGVEAAWREAAAAVAEILSSGRDAAFPTLGDPSFYSTALHMAGVLRGGWPMARIEVVPGVSSISVAAASAGIPLVLGNERMAILPATYEDERLKAALCEFDTVILMKIHRVLPRVLELLKSEGFFPLPGHVWIVERGGMEGEKIYSTDADFASLGEKTLHYFSTMIVRRRGEIDERAR